MKTILYARLKDNWPVECREQFEPPAGAGWTPFTREGYAAFLKANHRETPKCKIALPKDPSSGPSKKLIFAIAFGSAFLTGALILIAARFI